MCGRFTLTITGRDLVELFRVAEWPELSPRYNVAPTQAVPIVRSGEGGGREAALVRWGLVPHWSQGPGTLRSDLINARGETAATKPAFRDPWRRRRCLVPADGFYEWRREAGGKQPYRIAFADRRPFAFAGLWERWEPEEGEPVESCTILTCAPSDLVRPIHDRMPVIVPAAEHERWLDPEADPERLPELVRPHPDEGMEAYPVDRRVGSPAFDRPECVERLPVDPGLPW